MRSKPPKWLWLALMYTFWWGLWAFLVKLGSGRLDPFQLQALFVAGIMPLMALVIARRGPTLKADLLGIVYGMLNGVLATLGMLAFYAAMERGRASIVGPVTALFPIVTVVGSTLFLRERLNGVQCVGVCLALVAMLLFA